MDFTDADMVPVEKIVSDDIFTKPTGNTLRMSYNYGPQGFGYECVRHSTKDGRIPITEADDVLNIRDILDSAFSPRGSWSSYHSRRTFSLEHHDLFDTFIELLKSKCTSMVSTYNKRSGTDTTTYTLPVTNYLNPSDYFQEDIYNPIECPKKGTKKKQQVSSKKRKSHSWKWYETRKVTDEQRYKCIRINGNLYNVENVYKRVANGFEAIVVHKTPESLLNVDEQSVKNTCSVGTGVVVKFHNDTKINGFILEPERMIFENVYEDDNFRSRRNRSKGFIKCLVNDPGFITKFKLSYRTAHSDWIEHGIYDGNSSYHDYVKIVFDEELIAKELRIEPINHKGSFEKVSVRPYVKYIPDEKDDEITEVTYRVIIPREIRSYSRKMDSVVYGKWQFDRRNTKGDKKIQQRAFADACDLYDM